MSAKSRGTEFQGFCPGCPVRARARMRRRGGRPGRSGGVEASRRSLLGTTHIILRIINIPLARATFQQKLVVRNSNDSARGARGRARARMRRRGGRPGRSEGVEASRRSLLGTTHIILRIINIPLARATFLQKLVAFNSNDSARGPDGRAYAHTAAPQPPGALPGGHKQPRLTRLPLVEKVSLQLNKDSQRD